MTIHYVIESLFMETAFQRDQLDNHILEALMQDARTPFAELAKRFGVSAGTIHVRVEKMKQDRKSVV